MYSWPKVKVHSALVCALCTVRVTRQNIDGSGDSLSFFLFIMLIKLVQTATLIRVSFLLSGKAELSLMKVAVSTSSMSSRKLTP